MRGRYNRGRETEPPPPQKKSVLEVGLLNQVRQGRPLVAEQ